MATLVYSDSDGRDRSFALGKDAVTIGRAPECTIRSEDPRVSRMHARLFFDQGGLWVEDLGSTHGIYVGANKVQRAPVPPGEVVLIGSLLLRLVPATGTMPPPIGLHGTLATWLDLERKNRAAVEEERDAFAKRVGELHQEIAAVKNAVGGPTLKPGDEISVTDTETGMQAGMEPTMAAEAIRLRDEADARAAALERALAAVQDELMVLRQAGASVNPDEDLKRVRTELAVARDRLVDVERDLADRAEWSTLVGAEHTKLAKELEQIKVELDSAKGNLDEVKSARSIAEHAAGEAMRESQNLRKEIDELRRQSAADLEIARMEAARAHEGGLVGGMSQGLDAASRLAELDLEIVDLRRQLTEAKLAPRAASIDSDSRVQELTEMVAVVTGRADKAEKELSAAQIRAQGAERNLSGANSAAAKAETRAAQLEEKVTTGEAKVKGVEDELAKAREKITALETRVGAGDAPVQAAEARAAKIVAELKDVNAQYETTRSRIAELEDKVSSAEKAKRDAETMAEQIKGQITSAHTKLGEAEKRAAGLQAKLDDLSKADFAIAAAAKTRDDATTRASAAEQQVTEAIRRAEDAEKRASAADTMAKAMAKDVAEALRRAADADTQKRSGARELADLMRRASEAEAKNATSGNTIKGAEERATQAEARAEEIRKELADTVAAAQKELADTLAAAQKDLGAKLEAAQRELAAERKTSLALVDRKTQLERELAEARAALPEAVRRAEAAEQRASEYEVQIETLQERVDDLESSLAVTETASQATAGESAERVAALQKQLGEQSELRSKVERLEQAIVKTTRERDEAREELRRTKEEMTLAVREAESRATSTEEDRERLDDAIRRADDAERKADALMAQSETADLAIGRAGALQRQLDEALAKLAFMERDSSRPREMPRERPEVSDAIANDRIAAAETRTKEAEARIKDVEDQLVEAERNAAQAREEVAHTASQFAELQRRAQLAEEAIARVGDAERRSQAAEEMLRDAEARAQHSEMQVAEMTARVAEVAARAPAGNEAFERQLFDAQRKIAELEREVANADNVRSFAAETEREIAQLQRDLRETKSRLTQVTLERDRLAADLRDARGDSETTNRRAPIDPKAARKAERDEEITAKADMARYEPIIQKATELQVKVIDLEKTNAQLRAQLADAEQRLREAIDGDDDGTDDSEMTHTGSQLPIAFAEHLSVLEESIDSLRANMRAASDETAMMDQSDSVIAVSSAVSQAAEHIERARAAIRAMNSAIGAS